MGVTGSPSPARMSGAKLPEIILARLADLPDDTPHAADYALRYRFVLEKHFGLPSNDPWIVAGCMAACMHIETMAQMAEQAGTLNHEEVYAAGALAIQSAAIWAEILRQLDAVPNPQEN